MTSLISFKAQPVTRTFTVTQGPNQTGVYLFTNFNVAQWYSNNASDVRKVSDSLYIVTGDFENVMNNLNYDTTYDGRKSLIDFGKEIVFGNEVNSRLLVLRRVQVYNGADVGGDGYVVTENNTSGLAPSDWGRFTIRVARA